MRIGAAAIVPLLAALVSTESSSAQVAAASDAQMWAELRAQSAEQIAKDQTDFWTRTLALTAEQAAALHQINLRYSGDMRLAARLPTSDAQKIDPLLSLEDDKTDEVLELLTPAQRARYAEFTGHLQGVREQAQSP